MIIDSLLTAEGAHRLGSFLRSIWYYRVHLAARALPTDSRFFQKGPGTINNKAIKQHASTNMSENVT